MKGTSFLIGLWQLLLLLKLIATSSALCSELMCMVILDTGWWDGPQVMDKDTWGGPLRLKWLVQSQ